MSIAGAEKVNELAGRHAGSVSNIRRSEGNPKPPANRSNNRSISLRNDRHTSGTAGSAAGAFLTSTGTSAIVVSIVGARERVNLTHRPSWARASAETLIQRNSRRPALPPPCPHRPLYPLARERGRRCARQRAGAFHLVKHGLGVGADLFIDQRQGRALGAAAIFDRCA